MCHWVTGEWAHCQLTHMELQSQPNSTGMETVKDELKHSAVHTPRESPNVSMGVVGANVVASKFLKVLQMRVP